MLAGSPRRDQKTEAGGERNKRMTDEERRAKYRIYKREWNRRNKDRIKLYLVEYRRRKALEAILAEREVTA